MSSQLFRVSGIGLLVGAATFIVHIAARSAITAAAGGDTATFAKEGAWVTINALGVIGPALVLLGMPAMYARIAGPIGLLGLVGVFLIALGWLDVFRSVPDPVQRDCVAVVGRQGALARRRHQPRVRG